MPGGDRTGPLGQGPMTGRAVGYCAGYGVPGYTNPGGGRGFGFGGGGRGWGGHGWRNRYHATGLTGWQRGAGAVPAWSFPAPYPIPAPAPAYTREQELAMLREQARSIEGALADIRKRVEELESNEEAG